MTAALPRRPIRVTRDLIGDAWCPDCGGEGQHFTSRHGGNDPDVWPRGACETCRGSGLRALYTPSRRRFRADPPHWVSRAPGGRVAAALATAAKARLTLAGRQLGSGFWSSPVIVRDCWRQNMDAARATRVSA